MHKTKICWCGNTKLEHFSKEYLKCNSCGTLVVASMPHINILETSKKDTGLYGRNYWFSHQQDDLGYGNITERSRADLSERCLYWLKTLLKYNLPPAKILELGCAHGGFTSLLNTLEFDATGLEISPWVVNYAKKTFKIPMLLGPIEQQTITKQSLDVIVMMDVLEHLQDPMKTLKYCFSLLKTDGILIIQTPQYHENKSFEEMKSENDPFLTVLQEKEHLYLFTKPSINKLFEQLGAKHISFEPALFPYDMFSIVGRSPLTQNSKEKIEATLIANPQVRIIQAALDLFEKNNLENIQIQQKEQEIKLLEEICRDRERIIFDAQKNLKKQISSLQLQANKNLKVPNGIIKKHISSIDNLFGDKYNKIIAIDLTPLQLGGENGGAKIMTINLIRNLAQISPNYKYILLTTRENHQELGYLDSQNIDRFCTTHDIPSAKKRKLIANLITQGIKLISHMKINLPDFIKNKAKYSTNKLLYKVNKLAKPPSLLKNLSADLLFCPFTAPYFFDNDIPTVSIIYDIQYKYYPAFFSPQDWYVRNKNFESACTHANYLICISDFVRKTVLENSKASSKKTHTIHICLTDRLPKINNKEHITTLKRFSLQKNNFLLYPANFWKHKNHEMLFTAYAIYRAKHPESNLQLVCTGAPGSRMNKLNEISIKIGFKNNIILPGYVSDEEFLALISSCKALIFPSLYEGFGMPVVEAMSIGKPALCSNVTSLPEIAENAAIFFDPRKPKEICSAIEKLDNDQDFVKRVVKLGYQQAKKFGNSMDMANKYLQILQTAMDKK